MNPFKSSLKFFIMFFIFPTCVDATEITNLVKPVYYFVGRKEAITAIDSIFKNKEKIVSLVGLAGMGKTELARKYAESKANNYKVIWYFDMARNLQVQFQVLARKINEILENGNITVSEDISLVEESVKNYIKEQDNWLLIFDNFDIGFNGDYRNFILTDHNFDALVIAKDATGLNNKVFIAELSDQESLRVINKIASAIPVSTKKTLIKKIKGFPLLLVQSIYLIKDSQFVTQKIIEEENNNILSKITLDLINSINKEQLNDLLRIILLDISNLDKNLLYKIVVNQESLYYFNNLNLLKKNHNIKTNQELNYMSVNQSIKDKILELTKNELILAQLDNVIDEVNQILASARSYSPVDILNVYPNIITNLECLLDNAEKQNLSVYKILELRKKLIEIYFASLDYKKTLKMLDWFRKNKIQFKKELMNDFQKEAFAEFLIEDAQYKTHIEDNPKEGILLFKEAIDFLNKTNLEKTKFFALTQYAQAYICSGNTNEAIININKAKEIIASNNDIKEYQTGFLYTDAKIHLEKGNYKEALNQVNKDINSVDFIHNTDSEVMYELKSEILLRNNAFQEAYENSMESLKRIQNYFKDTKHDLEIRAIIFLAWSEAGTGKIEEAKKHIAEARTFFFKDKNNEDRKGGEFLAYIPFVEGIIYEYDKNYDKALICFEEASKNLKLIYDQALENDFYGMILEKSALIARKIDDNLKYEHYAIIHENIFGKFNDRARRIDGL